MTHKFLPTDIEAAFRLVNREVWVVTAAHGTCRSGLVATCVMQSSLDPACPRIVVGLTPGHFTTELVDASKAYSLHLLAADQIDMVWRFGMESGRDRDKFADLGIQPGATGVPRLSGCLASYDCRVVDRFDAGDRIWFWPDVVATSIGRPGVPLTERDLVTAATPEQRAALQVNLLTDSKLQRRRYESWRTTHTAIT